MWETLRNALGWSQPTARPFESKKPSKAADKDSLRFHQAWYGQWDDERQRGVLIANHVREEGGYWSAIGFAPHPVSVSFGELPATINAVPPADRHAFLSAPPDLRAYKPRFVPQD